MKLTVGSNPWTLPGPPVDLEGCPSPEERERDEAEARARREVWEPGPEAFELVEQLKRFVGRRVVIQGWDPIMFLLDDEGPCPVRASCVDVILRKGPTGHLRAYLVLENPSEMKTAIGSSGLAQLAPDGERWLFALDQLYEVESVEGQGDDH